MNQGWENTVVRIEKCKTIKALCSPESCLLFISSTCIFTKNNYSLGEGGVVDSSF